MNAPATTYAPPAEEGLEALPHRALIPCNEHALHGLLAATSALLDLDEHHAGVIRAEVGRYGAILNLQQPPPAELGLICTVSSYHAPGDTDIQRIGRAEYRGVTLEWRVAG